MHVQFCHTVSFSNPSAKEEANEEEGTISRPTSPDSPKEEEPGTQATPKESASNESEKASIEQPVSRVGSAVATGRGKVK